MDEESFQKARRLNLECTITMVYADGFRVVSNFRNISETGAYVHTREPPQAGTTITYSFYLGMIAQPFQGRALVRWVRPLPQPRGGEPSFGVGIEFEKIDQTAQVWISQQIDEQEKERDDTGRNPVFVEDGLNLDTQEFVAVGRLFDSLGDTSADEAFQPKGFMPESKAVSEQPTPEPDKKLKQRIKVTAPAEESEETAEAPPEVGEESPEPGIHIVVDLTDTFQVFVYPIEADGSQSESTIEITPRFEQHGEELEPSDMAARSPVPLLLCPDEAYRSELKAIHSNHPDLDTPICQMPVEAGWRALIAQVGLHVVHRSEQTKLTVFAPVGRQKLVEETLQGILSEGWRTQTQVRSQLTMVTPQDGPGSDPTKTHLLIDVGLFETRLLLRAPDGSEHAANHPKLGLNALHNALMAKAGITLEATYGLELHEDPIAEEIVREELAAMKAMGPLNIKLEDVELELEAADLTDYWQDLTSRLLEAIHSLVVEAQAEHVDSVQTLERDGYWPTLADQLKDQLGCEVQSVNLEELPATLAHRV